MRAFTLVEGLFASFILVLISGAIYIVTSIGMISWDSSRGKLEVVQELRQVMDGMTRESRQAQLASITLVGGVGADDGTKIYFTIPGVNDTISYYVQNNQLIREHPVGTWQVLANNVNYLSFNMSAAELQINIQANKTIKNASHTFSLIEGVKLRNE